MRLHPLSPIFAACFAMSLATGFSQEPQKPQEKGVKVSLVEEVKELAKIPAQSEQLAMEQDELSADVMELVEEQTVPAAIKLLEEVEEIMAEVTDDLNETETGGPTIAAQTEIIEKIFEAAKKRQQQSGKGQNQPQDGADAMLEMMERMMGKKPGEGKEPGESEGEDEGEKAGKGQTGDSDSANESVNGANTAEGEKRTVPKGSGPAGRDLPNEFRQVLDAYNRNTK